MKKLPKLPNSDVSTTPSAVGTAAPAAGTKPYVKPERKKAHVTASKSKMKSPPHRDLCVSWRSLPTTKFDTGADVVVSPVPLVSAPVHPCDDATAPVTSTTSLGNQPCYTAPSSDSALMHPPSSYRSTRRTICTLQ